MLFNIYRLSRWIDENIGSFFFVISCREWNFTELTETINFELFIMTLHYVVKYWKDKKRKILWWAEESILNRYWCFCNSISKTGIIVPTFGVVIRWTNEMNSSLSFYGTRYGNFVYLRSVFSSFSFTFHYGKGIDGLFPNLLFYHIFRDRFQCNHSAVTHQKTQKAATIAQIHHVHDHFGFVQWHCLLFVRICLILSEISNRLRWMLFCQFDFHRYFPIQFAVDQTDDGNWSLLGYCTSN